MNMNKTRDKLQIGDIPISSLTVIDSFHSPATYPEQFLYILPWYLIHTTPPPPQQQPKMTVYHIGTLNLNLNLTLTLYHY